MVHSIQIQSVYKRCMIEIQPVFKFSVQVQLRPLGISLLEIIYVYGKSCWVRGGVYIQSVYKMQPVYKNVWNYSHFDWLTLQCSSAWNRQTVLVHYIHIYGNELEIPQFVTKDDDHFEHLFKIILLFLMLGFKVLFVW